MSNDDRAKKKLSAAVTVTGAVLWLTMAGVTGNRAQAYASLNDATSTRRPLSQRVKEMREKVRAALPLSNSSGSARKIQNIVQFFNFLNCMKTPTDPRCRK